MTRSTLSSLAGCAAALWLLPTAPAAGRADTAAPCRASALRGSFTHVPGSDGMGHAEYLLWLTNSSSQTCTEAGRPGLQILGQGGRPLPTHATAWQPGQSASAVALGPGGSAEAAALVAVDIPGPGDSHVPGRPCQPIAMQLRVGAAGTATLVPVQPPRAVCERGSILLKPLARLTPVMPSGLLAMLKKLLDYPPREYTLKLRYDTHDRSWVEWSWAPAGPADAIQGGTGFAHLVDSTWRNIWGPGNPAFCQLGVPTTIPTSVRRAFGITCAN